MNYILTNEKRLSELKEKIPRAKNLRRELEYLAEKYLHGPEYSVTFNKSPAASGNIHDYFSEGTYRWPDPKNPDGPYIRRDGYHNPDVFLNHLEDMWDISTAVFALSYAGFILEKEEYTEKAIKLISVWEFQQISASDAFTEKIPMKLAAVRYGDCELESIGASRRKNTVPFTNNSHLGFVDLL